MLKTKRDFEVDRLLGVLFEHYKMYFTTFRVIEDSKHWPLLREVLHGVALGNIDTTNSLGMVLSCAGRAKKYSYDVVSNKTLCGPIHWAVKPKKRGFNDA